MTDDAESTTTEDTELNTTDDSELSEEEKQQERLEAWAEVGATNFPALLVALGAGVVGGIGMLIRRRRRA